MHRVIGPEDPFWKSFETDFRKHGFLGSTVGEFRVHFRIVAKDWFDLADDLNELAQTIYIQGTRSLSGKSLRDPVALGLQMMPRCLGGFQASVLLCERGMSTEAMMLVRSIFETAFWMGYVVSDPANAIPQFERETLESEIGLFQTAGRHLVGLPSSVTAQVEQQVLEMKARRDSLPKPPKPEKLAELAGYAPAYFFYRQLSGAATHLSLKSIDSFLSRNESGQVIGHQLGPDEVGVGRTIWLAIRSMILAVDALQRLLGTPEFDEELQRLNGTMEELGPWEPKPL